MATSTIKPNIPMVYSPGLHEKIALGHCPGMSGSSSTTLQITATLPLIISKDSQITLNKLWLNLRIDGRTVEDFSQASLSSENGIDLTNTYIGGIEKVNSSSTQKIFITLSKKDGSAFSNLPGSEPVCPMMSISFTTT